MKKLLNINGRRIGLLIFIVLVLATGITHIGPWTSHQFDELSGPKRSKESYQNPGKRIEYERMLLGQIDPHEYQRSLKRVTKLSKAQMGKRLKDGGIKGWTDLGPLNVGGRIRAIEVSPANPDVILVGGASGGIWKTINQGGDWALMNPEHIAYPISDIQIDPSNSDKYIAATGELLGHFGAGMLISHDEGNTWQMTNIESNAFGARFTRVRFNPLNSQIVYAAGTTPHPLRNDSLGQIIRSDDGGRNWRNVYTEPPNANPNLSAIITDIEIRPSDTSELIIAPMGNLRITRNAGASYTSLLGAAPLITTPANFVQFRAEVAYCPANDSIIYVTRNLSRAQPNTLRTELWQSIDEGLTWTLLFDREGEDEKHNPLGKQGAYDQVLWVDPSDCSRVLIGGIDLWKYESNSLTRISNWQDDIGDLSGGQNSIHADQHYILEHADYNGSTNTEVFIGNDGGLYKANDIWTASANSGWSSLVSGLGLTQFYRGDASPDGEILIGGSQDNGTNMESNSSNGLKFWDHVVGGDGGYCFLSDFDTTVVFTTSQEGNIYRSTDGGQSFCQIASFEGNFFPFFNNLCIGGPYFSRDDTTIFIPPLVPDPNLDQVLYFGGRRLWATTDNGDTWNNIVED